MTDNTNTIAPIALGAGEGEALWFLGSLVTIKSSRDATGGTVAVLEHRSPRGAGSPLHVHRDEDEWFYVLEGELTFWVGGDGVVTPAGGFGFGPRGIPHTFVGSTEEAGCVLFPDPAGFEGFAGAMGGRAERREIPPAATQPPDVEGLVRVAAGFGLEILGPPGIPA